MSSEIAAEIADVLLNRKPGRATGSVYLFGSVVKRCKKFMFFRAGETIPCAFGKLARDAAQERLLESEATALRKFDAADADFVPRLLHFGPIGNWAALVTEYRDWHSMAEKVIKGQYGSSPEHALATLYGRRMAPARQKSLCRLEPIPVSPYPRITSPLGLRPWCSGKGRGV